MLLCKDNVLCCTFFFLIFRLGLRRRRRRSHKARNDQKENVDFDEEFPTTGEFVGFYCSSKILAPLFNFVLIVGCLVIFVSSVFLVIESEAEWTPIKTPDYFVFIISSVALVIWILERTKCCLLTIVYGWIAANCAYELVSGELHRICTICTVTCLLS